MINNNDQHIWQEAEQFIRTCYEELERSPEAATQRLLEIREELTARGTYTHTMDELVHGAKMAWRNSARCVGRLFWPTLDVIDERRANTEEEIAKALLNHIEKATNKGRIRPLMTVFVAQEQGRQPVRIWNHQLIRYAGYVTEDGIIGDPASVAFTNECLKLGWQGEETPFDVLPLVVQIGERKPKWFSVPEPYILEVPLLHPEEASFAELDLRWYAVPMISDMKLEIGGITYPAAPFNGWYMETEIGARNLADHDRYNQLPKVAKLFGLDTSTNTSLWKDRALVELNRAVLHSYKLKGVSIVDHHTASEQFIRFEEQEKKAGRAVSGRWSWLIPPMSPATTQIWRNTYKDLHVKPSLEYQEAPYGREQIAQTAGDNASSAHNSLISAPQEARCPFH